MKRFGISNLPCEHRMRIGSCGSSATTLEHEGNGRAEGCNATKGDGEGGITTGEVDAIGRQSSWINGFGSCNCHGFVTVLSCRVIFHF